VPYGDALNRPLDAFHRLHQEGIVVGLVNNCHLNCVDEDVMHPIGKSTFVIVVESQNTKTEFGIRFGAWLLDRGLPLNVVLCGTPADGCGGT